MKRWPFETIASISALVLSLCGVATSVVQTRLMMRQQRAATWPHLDHAAADALVENECHFQVDNNGTGPAIVRLVDVTWHDMHFDSLGAAFSAVLEKLKLDLKASGATHIDVRTTTSYMKDRTLRAGESVRWLVLHGASALEICQRLREEDLPLRIVYASVNDECWELTDEGTRPLDNCPNR